MRSLLNIILVGLIGSSGCTEKEAAAAAAQDGCQAFYLRVKQCMPHLVDRVSGEQMVSVCRVVAAEKQDDSLVAAQLRCAQKHADCAAFETCDQEARTWDTHRKAQRLAMQVREALERQDMELATSLCSRRDPPADVAAECRKVVEVSWVDTKLGLEIARDSASGDGGALCNKLVALGERRSGVARVQARTLCEEAAAAPLIEEAREAAEQHVAAGRARLPSACDEAMEALRGIGSKWSALRRAEIADACYVQLGRVILQENEVTARCSPAVRRVVHVVRSGPVRDLDLDELVRKARFTCRL